MSVAVFNNYNYLPSLFSTLHADELLSSWFKKIAFYQGLSTSELDKLIWGSGDRSADIDQFISDRRLHMLAEITNYSFQQLYAATLRSYNITECKSMITSSATEISTYYNENKKQDLTEIRYRSGLMFCPNCLRKNNYFKKEWRLTISLVCTACKCYLKDRCPHCMKQFTSIEQTNACPQYRCISDFIRACYHCNKDITDCTIIAAEQSTVDLQCELYAVLQTENESDGAKNSYFKVLLHLASFLQVDATRSNKINGFVNNIIELNGFSELRLRCFKEKPAKLSPETRTPFIFMAQWLMACWPYKLLSLCMTYNMHWREILPEIMTEHATLRDPVVDDLAYRIEDMGEIVDPKAMGEGDLPIRRRNLTKPPKFNYDYDIDLDAYYYDNEDKGG